jgi:hypothetical protein
MIIQIKMSHFNPSRPPYYSKGEQLKTTSRQTGRRFNAAICLLPDVKPASLLSCAAI